MLPKLVIISVKMGLVPAVRTWLNHHPAEIDSTDAKGNTLLHYAVLSGNSGLCSMLLDEYGANPHIANIDGNTAIEMAGEQQSDLFHLFKIFEQSTDDAAHESIQADIFDHIFAIVEEFGLRLHQSPTGNDIRSLAGAFKQ